MAEYDDPPLTPEQIANWRRAIPELRAATDIEVQLYRDKLQALANEDANESAKTTHWPT